MVDKRLSCPSSEAGPSGDLLRYYQGLVGKRFSKTALTLLRCIGSIVNFLVASGDFPFCFIARSLRSLNSFLAGFHKIASLFKIASIICFKLRSCLGRVSVTSHSIGSCRLGGATGECSVET
jgi:hypothetical protein